MLEAFCRDLLQCFEVACRIGVAWVIGIYQQVIWVRQALLQPFPSDDDLMIMGSMDQQKVSFWGCSVTLSQVSAQGWLQQLI